MAAVSCPCPLCKGRLVSSGKVRNSHMKICRYLPEERGKEEVETRYTVRSWGIWQSTVRACSVGYWKRGARARICQRRLAATASKRFFTISGSFLLWSEVIDAHISMSYSQIFIAELWLWIQVYIRPNLAKKKCLIPFDTNFVIANIKNASLSNSSTNFSMLIPLFNINWQPAKLIPNSLHTWDWLKQSRGSTWGSTSN